MKLTQVSAASAALILASCGGTKAPAGNQAALMANLTGAMAAQPDASAPVPEAQPGLVTPPSWMPSDWDHEVYQGSGEGLDGKGILRSRQNMLNTVPFTLWAVAHDTRVTEAFEPIWVWYTAIRSCERGIQMNDDLAGEFGNRERGKASLTTARNELKAWAATQPQELTMYFTAMLGEWNQTSGAFALQQLGRATTLKPSDIDAIDDLHDGATVELWTDSTGQAINHFQASLTAPQCVSKGKTKVYKFERMSQWWVVFGEADTGMGGTVNYKTHAFLPAIRMTRDAAAAFAQRNPQRKVVVAVTFVPAGSSFVKNLDQSAIRAKYRQVTITDALDGSLLVSQAY